MSQNQLILKWFIIFLGLILIGVCGILLYLSISPNLLIINKNHTFKGLNSSTNSAVNQIPNEEPSVTPLLKYNSTTAPCLKNPFIRPSITAQKRKHEPWLKYQGIIETDNIRYGLLKVAANSKTFMVQEGQYIPELGLEIKKITVSGLTYRKKNSTTVISLGGIKK